MEWFRGDYEGRPSSDQRGATDADYLAHGAESLKDLAERANTLKMAIAELSVESCLVVSHNQFGKVFVASVRGADPRNISELPNAKIFKV